VGVKLVSSSLSLLAEKRVPPLFPVKRRILKIDRFMVIPGQDLRRISVSRQAIFIQDTFDFDLLIVKI